MRHSRGLSFTGMLLVTAAVMAMGLLALRIVPVYLDHYNLMQSMRSLETPTEQSALSMPSDTAILLKKKLVEQLYINGIEIPGDQIQIKPNGSGGFHVHVNYQVTKPLIGNVSLLFHFNSSVEVQSGGQ